MAGKCKYKMNKAKFVFKIQQDYYYYSTNIQKTQLENYYFFIFNIYLSYLNGYKFFAREY